MRETVKHLLFPHKCVGCREKFNIFDSDFDPDAVYCSKCRSEWEKAKILPCTDCRMASIECTCVPDILEGLDVVSLFRFGTVLAADRMVYSMKRKPLPRVFAFAADELARRTVSYCRERKIDLSNAVVTFVPRSERSVKRYGFDHGKLLSRAVAEGLRLEHTELLRRRGRSIDQKKLTVDKRFRNSSNRFELLKDADVRDKTVIIVDDVITTGATSAACALAIYDGEPGRIMVLCLAKGGKTRRKK